MSDETKSAARAKAWMVGAFLVAVIIGGIGYTIHRTAHLRVGSVANNGYYSAFGSPPEERREAIRKASAESGVSEAELSRMADMLQRGEFKELTSESEKLTQEQRLTLLNSVREQQGKREKKLQAALGADYQRFAERRGEWMARSPGGTMMRMFMQQPGSGISVPTPARP